MPAGNEGAGVVIAAGDEPAAQALVGKTVGVLGGAMYGNIELATVVFADARRRDPERGACFVNFNGSWDGRNHADGGFFCLDPHCRASNLGQMLQKSVSLMTLK